MSFLNIESDKEEYLKKRIGALFSKMAIQRLESGAIGLSQSSKQDIESRKRIYEQELSDLAAVQIDIMRKDFEVDWSISESKDISIYIADAYIGQQMDLLGDIKAKSLLNLYSINVIATKIAYVTIFVIDLGYLKGRPHKLPRRY